MINIFCYTNKIYLDMNSKKEEEVFEEKYICIQCGQTKTITSTEPILCKYCQKRIFRKIRTDKTIKLLAR